MNCKVFPFMTSSSCTEPPNEKRFETYRRKDKILNWTLLYLRSTWNFPFKDECANLMSSSTLGIHGFVDLIFSIKITRIILSGNKKGLFVFHFFSYSSGGYYPGQETCDCAILPHVQPALRGVFSRSPLVCRAGTEEIRLQATARLHPVLGLAAAACSHPRRGQPGLGCVTEGWRWRAGFPHF